MIHTHYLFNELVFRKRRSAINILVVATAMGIVVFASLLTASLQKAFLAPLTDIGAAMTVQVAGDVPEQMAGPVLPCSVAPIDSARIARIRMLSGVQGLAETVLFWDFQPSSFKIVAGFAPDDTAGPALLRHALISGSFFTEKDSAVALADVSWAAGNKMVPGSRIHVGGRAFILKGIVDSSRISRIATAQVYIPLADAKAIVAGSASINAVHHFGPKDANLLFIKARRDKTSGIAAEISGILGKKATVTTPDSFKETLGSLFALTDRFAGLISGLVLIATLLLVARTTAVGIRERNREIGVMKAIGWRGRDILRQVAAESLVLLILGTMLGIAVGIVGGYLTTFVRITIPIPWEMAPSPHFLQGGPPQFSRVVSLSMSDPTKILMVAGGAALFIGLATVLSAGHAVIRLKPSEVFRHE